MSQNGGVCADEMCKDKRNGK